MIEEGEDEARNRTPEPGTSSDEEEELGRCTVWVPEAKRELSQIKKRREKRNCLLTIGRGKLGKWVGRD